MLDEPNCNKRRCKHYAGVGQKVDTEEEEFEFPQCYAFPTYPGIPAEIAYGEEKHLQPIPGQKNDIVYERNENA
jgi:hypothetical protein